MEVTRTLARFVVQHDASALPQAVRHEAARSILNWLGCALGASRHETVERALAALAPFSGPREATVLGRSDRLDIMLAALVNGISSHTFDFDDTHLKTVIHPSGPVASAILALAERQAGLRRGVPACIRARRRGRVPHRQLGLPGALRRGLAHHGHGGRFRSGRGGGEAAWAFRAADGVGARDRGDAGERRARNVRHHVQAVSPRQRGA